MPHARGYSIVIDPAVARPLEHDTLQCVHCQRILVLKPGSGGTTYLFHHRDGRVTEAPGAWCGRCDAPVCLACHADGRCRPWEAQLLVLEAAERNRRWS